MRDGVRLYTAVYSPAGVSSAPVLFLRTPFQLKPYGPGRYDRKLRTSLSEFVKAGYIIVNQNVRGTYMSEGEFVNVRPDGKEREDCHDSIEWIVSNTACNGNVGVKGMSYPGFYAVEAALCGHPALKAVSPQAPVTDWYRGDDLHHNGALLLNDVYGFGRFFFRERRRPGPKALPTRAERTDDIRRFFLDKGSLADTLSPYLKKGGFWKDLADHPHYDDFWKERNSAAGLASAPELPPLLFVGGTFDGEDCFGPLECFKAVESRPPEDRWKKDAFLVLGPWAHGSWLHEDFDHLAGASLGQGLSEWFMKKIEFPFFSRYLEGRGRRPDARIQIFPSKARPYTGQPDEECDSMVICADEWPLPFTCTERLYPAAGRRLRPETPRSCEYSYVSDPRDPVPALASADRMVRDHMAADQSFTDGRKDVLSFTGPVLKDAVCMLGEITANLKVRCSTDDADIIVDLIDIRPDGYKMPVRSGILPLRYRKSLSSPEPAVPGEETVIRFGMNAVAHVFEPGHRIMVRIKSSCYPLYAMPAQKYMDNPLLAGSDDYTTASISVLCGPDSYIEFGII